MSYVIRPAWPDETASVIERIEEARWRLAWTIVNLRESIAAAKESAAQVRKSIAVRAPIRHRGARPNTDQAVG